MVTRAINFLARKNSLGRSDDFHVDVFSPASFRDSRARSSKPY